MKLRKQALGVNLELGKAHSPESPVGIDWHVPQGPPNHGLDRFCVPPRVEVSLDPLKGTLGRSFASYFSICDTTGMILCLGLREDLKSPILTGSLFRQALLFRRHGEDLP